MKDSPTPSRGRRLLLAFALLLCAPATVPAQPNWITSVPPERLLRWQPHTAAEFADPRGLFERTPDLPSTFSDVSSGDALPLSAAWHELGPPARCMHALVFDSRRQRLLMLGGLGAQDPAGSVWSYDPQDGEWAQIATLGWASYGPWSPSKVAAAAYDSLRDQLIVMPASGQLELQALSLAGTPVWSHLWTGPMASQEPAGMAIDTRRDAVNLLGVWDEMASAHRIIRVPLADPAAWTSELTQGTQPGIPERGSAVYDAARDVFDVLIGPGELYALNASGPPAWTEVPGSGTTPAPPLWTEDFPVMLALDVEQDRLLLVARTGSVLALPLAGGTAKWLTSALEPSTSRYGAAIAFDPGSRRVYLSGGSTSDYFDMAKSVAPLFASASVDSAVPGAAASWRTARGGELGSRWMHEMRIDPVAKQMVVFGYQVPGVMVRPLSGAGGWSALGAGSDSMPRERVWHSHAIDPGRHAMLWYGGQALNGDLMADLWLLPLAAGGKWQRVEVTGPTPGPRRYAAFAYDAARSRFILLGGDDLHETISDAWELRLDPAPAWRQLMVDGPMPSYVTLFADEMGGAFWAAHYGFNPLSYLRPGNDNIRFEEVSSMGGSGTFSRRPYLAGFDTAQRRLFWFPDPYGSGGLSILFDQLWTTTLAGATADWQLGNVPGHSPTIRGLAATAYDPISSRILLDGGLMDNGSYFADTWELKLAPEIPTAVLASLVEAVSSAAGVLLRWDVSVPAGTACTVERSADAVSWLAVGGADWTTSHEIRFSDAPLARDARIAYRLRIAAIGGDVVGAPIWLSAPTGRLGLAIEAMANPSRGALSLRLALASETPAQLRVLDVTGRVVLEAIVPAGTQRWRSTAAITPGLYFAQLSQSGERRGTRVVITP